MAYSLMENEAKVEQMHEIVRIINNYVAYLEWFLKENEDMIKALKEKLNVNEKELAHFAYVVNKMMTGSKFFE